MPLKSRFPGLLPAFLLVVTPLGAQIPASAQTPAERVAGVVPTAPRYSELDIRRYGAVCDYDAGSEIDGSLPRHATDNLPAMNAARQVIKAKGGGTMLIQGGGDCYLSNGFDARGISDFYIYVEPGTTVRTTRYTRLGGMIALGSSGPDKPVQNIGIFGGGTLRNFRPEHATLARWKSRTAYDVGDYVLSTDRNGEKRAYYARTAGISGVTAPSVLNGSQSDGGISWQDADNDNLVGISGSNGFVVGMNMPAASGKFATAQGFGWKNIWFLDNHGGRTNDKGFEVKGQIGLAGRENDFGDGALIEGNVVESAGREGIEAQQSAQGIHRNRNIRIVGNLVKDAGVIASAAGIRVNRADGVEIRDNQVLRSRGNCYHLRRSKKVIGDLYGKDCGHFGVHMQELEGFSFDSIYIKGASGPAVRDTEGSDGGYVGQLRLDGVRAAGWETIGRKGVPPLIASHAISAVGPQFVGVRPTFLRRANAGSAAGRQFAKNRTRALPNADAVKLSVLDVTITNTAGTLEYHVVDDVADVRASSNANSMTGTDASVRPVTGTAVGAQSPVRGTLSSIATNEFIFDDSNPAGGAQNVGAVVVVSNDTTTAVDASMARGTDAVNGKSVERWHVQFRRRSDGKEFALDTTNIPPGRKIVVKVVISSHGTLALWFRSGSDDPTRVLL